MFISRSSLKISMRLRCWQRHLHLAGGPPAEHDSLPSIGHRVVAPCRGFHLQRGPMLAEGPPKSIKENISIWAYDSRLIWHFSYHMKWCHINSYHIPYQIWYHFISLKAIWMKWLAGLFAVEWRFPALPLGHGREHDDMYPGGLHRCGSSVEGDQKRKDLSLNQETQLRKMSWR